MLPEIIDDHLFVTDDLGQDYPELIGYVKRAGNTVPSRVGETREVLDLQLHLLRPEHCIVTREGFSKKFMEEEITQLLAGKHDHDRLEICSKVAASLITSRTAYGPRTWSQLDFVAQELSSNPTSRRAVVYVGRDDDLSNVNSHDIGQAMAGEMPCTMTWQFHLRRDNLFMTANMRSWDLVWGLSYDVPSFVSVQLALADHLGVKVGTYLHNAGSAHIYDRHYDIKTESLTKKLDISHLLMGSIVKTRNNARKVLEGG